VVRFAVLVLAMCCLFQQAFAAPGSYRFGKVMTIHIDGPAESTPKEDKRFFDCRDFHVTERDVAYAIRHARPVTERYFLDELVGVGCFVGATVSFANGDRVDVLLEPSGRISARPQDGRDAGRHSYYECRACARSEWWGRARPAASAPRR